MAAFELAPLGRLDFPKNADGSWEFELPRQGEPIRLDFNVDGSELTPQAFNSVKQFVEQADAYDTTARKAIRADFDADSESSSAEYLRHHIEEFSAAERQKYFGAQDLNVLGVEHLLKGLRLQRIGLYPGSDSYVAVLDYSVDPDATQYILAVEFDASGKVYGISMDS